jgi:thioredoxin-like negative regulator of GroEL
MKRIVRFTASWCAPCKALSANLEKIETDIPIEVIDIDAQMDIAINAGVRSVPTMVMFEDDTELKRNTGVMNESQLKDWING